MKPTFFRTPLELRDWLERHHDTRPELFVGFYKKGSGKPSITWPESVDEALCFGWIDGIRRTIDDESYEQRQKDQRLAPAYAAKLKANRKAWTFFRSQAPWYQRTVSRWVMSAKKEETKLRRLATLVDDSAHQRRIGPVRRPVK
jgi:uncharacterized protein YdeI (YjbR/CyaY-like superfamily)